MKWASWTNVLLGVWLVAAPFALAYQGVTTALYEDIVLGAVIALFAFWRAMGEEKSGMAGVSWTVAAAGLWVLIAPFVLGYGAVTAAVYNDVIVGLAVAILGTWRAMSAGHGEMPHMASHH